MLRWLVLALAACGGGSAHAIDAAPDVAQTPDVDGFDIVVSSIQVVVWVGFTGALATNGKFAAPGACGGTSDAFAIAPSCFEGLDLDNLTLDPASSSPALVNPFVSSHPTTATSMLSASDCGHRIEIPLHAGPFATATNVTGARDGQDIVVSWTTSAPSAIASLSTTGGEIDCDDIGASQHRFGGDNTGSAVQVSVQPLSAPETTQTDLGEVRVWYGDRIDFTIP